MTTELENDIRDALRHRAETISTDTRSVAQRPRRIRPRPTWHVLAAAAAVAVLAVAVAVAAWRGTAHHTQPGGGPPVTLVPRDKTTWRLVRASTPDGTVVSGAVVPAGLNFKPHRLLLGSDGINTINASYVPTGDGFRINTIDVERGRYSGHDQRVFAVQQAIDALFGGRAGATVPVQSRLRGNHLTLTTRGYSFTFRFQG